MSTVRGYQVKGVIKRLQPLPPLHLPQCNKLSQHIADVEAIFPLACIHNLHEGRNTQRMRAEVMAELFCLCSLHIFTGAYKI